MFDSTESLRGLQYARLEPVAAEEPAAAEALELASPELDAAEEPATVDALEPASPEPVAEDAAALTVKWLRRLATSFVAQAADISRKTAKGSSIQIKRL